MKQLLVKLSDEEYHALEEYCKESGRTKSAVIRYYISKLKRGVDYDQLQRRVNRIDAGKGKLVSALILEMRV